MRIPWIPPFKGRHLETELADAGSLPLLRAFRHEGSDWEPAPPEFRQGRVDPPPGHESSYAMLYTAASIQGIAAEARVLRCDERGTCWSPSRASKWRVASYSLGRAGLFLPIDGRNRDIFGIEDAYEEHPLTMRSLGLELHRRYGHLAHGLCWSSFHRGQPGRCYAIWHSRKEHLCLERSRDSPALIDDARWRRFLAAHPYIVAREFEEDLCPQREMASLRIS